ncbi:enoyl-CoA hydratase, partial [Streptomyces sp. SID8455]|nr:enoyl-CoA hydratase [Streptomyces sp. SID8455]
MSESSGTPSTPGPYGTILVERRGRTALLTLNR